MRSAITRNHLPVLFTLLVFTAIVTASCGRGRSGATPQLPADPPLSTAAGWALVADGYAVIRSAPDPDAGNVGNARKGSVARVEESRFDARGSGEGGTWYLITLPEGKGWVHASSLQLYPSEARARRAAGKAP